MPLAKVATSDEDGGGADEVISFGLRAAIRCDAIYCSTCATASIEIPNVMVDSEADEETGSSSTISSTSLITEAVVPISNRKIADCFVAVRAPKRENSCFPGSCAYTAAAMSIGS